MYNLVLTETAMLSVYKTLTEKRGKELNQKQRSLSEIGVFDKNDKIMTIVMIIFLIMFVTHGHKVFWVIYQTVLLCSLIKSFIH